jgi:hypothetical protein
MTNYERTPENEAFVRNTVKDLIRQNEDYRRNVGHNRKMAKQYAHEAEKAQISVEGSQVVIGQLVAWLEGES